VLAKLHWHTTGCANACVRACECASCAFTGAYLLAHDTRTESSARPCILQSNFQQMKGKFKALRIESHGRAVSGAVAVEAMGVRYEVPKQILVS
jgi:hypothetical protein